MKMVFLIIIAGIVAACETSSVRLMDGSDAAGRSPYRPAPPSKLPRQAIRTTNLLTNRGSSGHCRLNELLAQLREWVNRDKGGGVQYEPQFVV